jgi:hypothetical protein
MRHVLFPSSRINSAAFILLFLFSGLNAQSQNLTTIFPQFASGGGWSSDIFIRNQGVTAPIVLVSIFNDDGTPLTVDSTLGVGSVFSFSLNVGSTQAIRANAAGVRKTGYVVISFPPGAFIAASEIFRYTQDGTVTTECGVPQQYPFTTFTFSAEVDSLHGVDTGLAIANSGGAQSFAVTLIRNDSSIQSTTTVFLPQGGHIAEYLESVFPGLDGFSGVVQVSAALPFGLVALRQDQTIFATVSIDNGPLLGPFFLNTNVTAAITPNYTAAQANTIFSPTVVGGTILNGPAYFKFTGRQGDVVTVQLSTAGLSSALDSIVYLLGTDGTTVLGFNDDNGLFVQSGSYSQPQSDSFLQAVLPSDGAFYIVVSDANVQGRTNNYYRLHFQLVTPAASGTR